jgi:hypothetical protein
MKKLKYIFLLITILLLSCNNDVLDKKPLDIISDVDLWNDPALIDAYLTQCYDEIGFINDIEYSPSAGWWDQWFQLATQTNCTDECTSGWTGYAAGYNGFKSNMLSVDKKFADWWGYPLIRKLNVFIENLPSSPVNDDLKKQRIAEARFLRAYSYFSLVKRYGGVPLITKAQTTDAPYDELYAKRNKEEAIYNFIISEIDEIANDLKDAQNDGGRPTKYAAISLKARAAMYAGSIATWGEVQLDGVVGIPSGQAQSFWQKSYDASKLIIDSKKFALYNKTPEDKVSNFRNIFLDENNEEVIFSEIYDGQSGKGHSWDLLNDPFGYQAWGVGGESVAYLEMAEEFENIDGSSGKIDRQKIASGYLWTIDELFGNKDPRFRASILTQDGKWLGDTIDVYRGIIKEDGTITEDNYKGVSGKGKSTSNQPYATPFMMLKHLDESLGIAPNIGTSKTDWIVFRYGETLLNFAEAAFALGKTEEALNSVNQIRTRAGIATLNSIDLQKIRHERKVELAFEGNRYWDVRRWRTAVTELSIPLSGMKFNLDYTTRKFKLQIIPNLDGAIAGEFAPRNYYLPIGLSRTTNNPNLIENPGYN